MISFCRSIFVCVLLLVSHTSWASVVKGFKGKTVIVHMEPEKFKAGQTLSVVNSKGNAVAFLKVTKVKGSEATTQLLKGQVVNWMKVVSYSAAPTKNSNMPEKGTPPAAGADSFDKFFDNDPANDKANAVGKPVATPAKKTEDSFDKFFEDKRNNKPVSGQQAKASSTAKAAPPAQTKSEEGFDKFFEDKNKSAPPAKSNSAAASQPDNAPKARSPGVARVGGIVNMSSDSADVKFTTTSGSSRTVSLDGFGFGAKGLYDYPIMEQFWFRAMGGLSMFNVGGANSCGGECTVEVTYLNLEAWGRVPFTQLAMTPWAGGGFQLLYPLAKSSSVLDKDSIKATSLLAIGGGLDIKLNSNSWLPIQIDYGFAPSSDAVEATSISIRAGYSMKF